MFFLSSSMRDSRPDFSLLMIDFRSWLFILQMISWSKCIRIFWKPCVSFGYNLVGVCIRSKALLYLVNDFAPRRIAHESHCLQIFLLTSSSSSNEDFKCRVPLIFHRNYRHSLVHDQHVPSIMKRCNSLHSFYALERALLFEGT